MHTTTPPDDKERLRQLAQALECLTEEEHLLLTGWAPETAKAKRKRGEGPPYIRHGLHYFYPRKQYAEYMGDHVRQRAAVPAAGQL